MASKNSDQLFQLVKSLTKAEKRHFKLLASRVKSAEDAKFIKLFDAIDKQSDYDEQKILDKIQAIKSSQLSNLKAHLYKQILQALRLYHSSNDIEIRIRDLIDYSTILYNRCLYDQSIKLIEKAKSLALEYEKTSLLYQILEHEKRLVTRFIKSNIEDRVTRIIAESEEISHKLSNLNTFTNLSIKLYSFYLKIGFIRNHKDFQLVNSFLYSTLPVFKEEQLSFDEKMYLYNSLTGFYFFIQDYVRGYEYAHKWVKLFDHNPQYISAKIEMYIKALNNLLVSQSKRSCYDEFNEIIKKLEVLYDLPDNVLTVNVRLMLFKYTSTHNINKYFLLGQFTEGIKVVPRVLEELNEFRDKLDTHYILIFYYKFACMYFGASQFKQAAYWCNEVINTKEVDLRSDIFSFARILLLISHYELGNVELVDHLIRSTYRYLITKENLRNFQRIIIKFLRRLTNITPDQLTTEFSKLRDQLLPLADNPYEKISFIYFDIISWLESRIESRPVEEIIREKAEKRIIS